MNKFIILLTIPVLLISSVLNQELINYTNHHLSIPKKYSFQGVNTAETLELRYKNPENNITYYLTSYKLPPKTDNNNYLDSYRENQKNGGFSIKDFTFQAKRAVLGTMRLQTAYIYQLHFVNKDKGQTIQMLAGKPSDKEFEIFKNDIIITK